MSGLLGMALLGGAEGAGTAVAGAANQQIQAYHANEHEQLKSDLMAQREQNLANINNAASQTRTETTETGANTRNAASITSAEKIAAERNKTLQQTSKLGVGAIQQDIDGNIFVVGADRKATPLLDPDGNQLKGYKDLTPAAKQYAASLTAQLQGLDRADLSPTLDDSGHAQIQQRRIDLNKSLLNVLTGGMGAAAQPSTPSNRPPLSDFNKKPQPAINAAPMAAPAAPAPAAQPDAESFIPPQYTGSQAQRRINPAYQKFVATYGETPTKFIGQGRPNPAYEQWKQRVLSGNQ